MARYRLLQEAFMPSRPGDFCRKLEVNAEVVLADDDIGLGPHLEPLDDAARKARAEYDRRFPGGMSRLDPTSHLPLGQDPMVSINLGAEVQRQLDRKLSIAASGVSAPVPSSEVAELRAQLDDLQKQLADLIAANSRPAIAAPRKGAA